MFQIDDLRTVKRSSRHNISPTEQQMTLVYPTTLIALIGCIKWFKSYCKSFKNTDLYGYSPDVVKEEDGHHETVGIHRHVIYDLTSGHLSIGDGQAGQR